MVRHFLTGLIIAAVAACSPADKGGDAPNNGQQGGVKAVKPDQPAKAAPDTASPTVVLTRNLDSSLVKTGKPLPKKRIVLKRAERIDVIGTKGVSSFVGPGTVTSDGEFIAGGGGSGGEDHHGLGSGSPILHIGGTRIDAAKASDTASPPRPPLPYPLAPAADKAPE